MQAHLVLWRQRPSLIFQLKDGLSSSVERIACSVESLVESLRQAQGRLPMAMDSLKSLAFEVIMGMVSVGIFC